MGRALRGAPCRIDPAYGEPGTEVTLVRGEAPDSPNPEVEPNEQTSIRATVGEVPYAEDRRR